ncbi:squamosa promoter-binding-like protein 7 [Cicer arietinum]|uniref:Squamosa promoter-binding-like protein 7 n=1 Tax=Cicer arietinum TaxID=3827 RepID=A0A1S2Z2N0_CICAR|nr:squamosa promoter-binding-like protein 7 [Cicer arietinum]
MDFGGNMFCLNNRDQNNVTNGNSNSNGFTWVSTWDTTNTFHVTAENSAVNRQEGGLANALMFVPHNAVGGRQYRSNYAEAYGGRDLSNSHVQLDPHLTCLKLGKRHYFEDASGGGGGGGLVVSDKRGKGGYCSGGKTSAALGVGSSVARCQVEGCHVALMNAKEYHKRHKVCEMHSKAPKVVVLGLEQRFCQQCSRFHVVSEFDDSKRSCRRRLAGHNERRRKSSHDSVARNSQQGECALSLLSSRTDSWLSPADLSIRCSAALSELIAENRAAIMARQYVPERDWHVQHHSVEDYKEIQQESNYFPQQMFPQTH